jgi:DNA-binding NtrC family response regulator
LENVVRKAMLLASKYTITVDHVRAVLSQMEEPAAVLGRSLAPGISEYLTRARAGGFEGVHGRIIEDVERELFAQAIQMAHGNQAQAARWLGVSRITMREKLQRFGLHPTKNPPGETTA